MNKVDIIILILILIYIVKYNIDINIHNNIKNYIIKTVNNENVKIINLNKNLFINNNNFNPSIIFEYNGVYSNIIDDIYPDCNIIMSYRSSESQYDLFSKIYIKKKNKITYSKEDDTINITIDESNYLYSGYDKKGYEDSRFCIIKNKLFLLYSIFISNPFNINVNQTLSDYNNYNNQISFSGFKINRIEKNWILFENNNQLYLIYNFLPQLTIYSVDSNYNCTLFKNKKYNTPTIRGGTSPILINDYFYFFGHVQKNKKYFMAITIMDKNNFEIISYNNDLLNNIITTKFIYCRGAVYIKSLKKFILSVGINDNESKFIIIDKDYIDNKIIKI
jgi:predicted GH43/DUF377 family glycosyl hydrolase